MRPANLLIPNSTYVWQNSEEDLSESINQFQLAFEKVAKNEDQLFCMPDLWEQTINDELFIQILANYDRAVGEFPWLLQSHQRFLIDTLLNYPLNISPAESASLEDLDIELNDENNGIMQLGASEADRCVFNVKSWYTLHWTYLSTHNNYVDWTENDVLPGLEFSKLRLLEFVRNIDPTIMDEVVMIAYFEKELVRSMKHAEGLIIALAEQIAISNAYRENRELSSKEAQLMKSRRKIFEITKAGLKQYLSLDFENWQFEVCDHRGRHCGVWNFSGRKTKDADEKGGHDLRCLK